MANVAFYFQLVCFVMLVEKLTFSFDIVKNYAELRSSLNVTTASRGNLLDIELFWREPDCYVYTQSFPL
jgi:hypothetical protein